LELIVAVTAEYYRRLAQEGIEAGSTVVEIGCSTGRTTRLLARRCGRVVAVDVSQEMVVRVQKDLADCPNVLVARVDGRDAETLAQLAGRPDTVFVDVGGDALLENVLTVLWQCVRSLRPQRRVIVRSRNLAYLMRLVSEIEPIAFPEGRSDLPKPAPLESLLELSHSVHLGNRVFAARRLRTLDDLKAHQRLEEMRTDPSSKVRRIARADDERRHSEGQTHEPS
jgi:precorrin-6B methylase 2